jgi:hypothetical protein
MPSTVKLYPELSCEFLLAVTALYEEIFDEIHAGLLVVFGFKLLRGKYRKITGDKRNIWGLVFMWRGRQTGPRVRPVIGNVGESLLARLGCTGEVWW